ncbi:hypothetical protein A3B51_03340 [Candidatus Curtissbacteria bacterium RIFCSPLOWO2_01_FULL_41_18]|uniref:Antitoxin n=2 Tax=Candidatus Curtissiibacteriota TaxID=1752717 RepID=A0A1F5FZV2_9BACT|nr:MAG: hypothetical protein A2696_00085 [Candidatus Curtissbacteria bacterium RIFCSPHIGHO2_01_FULL_41_13]OGE05044.1 MAG: hypothetical protein A3B51_03340 [Candidatus Curtissbacteria bacterium RIFCSPLOWO2_01_FULL_41_18]
MTLTVSVSQFRRHIADYIAKAKEGHTVVLVDEKKDQQLVQLVGRKKFNPDTFGKALKASFGVFSMQNHPEWRTKSDVVRWVEKGRIAADRSF